MQPPRWDEFAEYYLDEVLRPEVVAEAKDDNERLAVERERNEPYWSQVLEEEVVVFLASPRQVRRTLRVVRELTTLYLLLREQIGPEEALKRLDGGSIHPNCVSDQPEWTFQTVLSVGLRPFHVSVDVRDPDTRYYGRGANDPWADPIDLFNVLCLSLVNDIANGADFKRCANETCRQEYFTHHRGRATQSKHHMTGVKYCSVECARAQKQREYRRRKRAEGKP